MNDQLLESYLARLDKCLGPIAISEKADIITEIKSHVLEAIENDASTNMNDALSSLGEPEQVANRYLMERGLKPNRPAKHPIVKWITIGFLGTFGITAFIFLVLIWKFSPLVKVDEEKGHVQILGGLIDVNEKQGKVKIGNDFVVNSFESEYEGEHAKSKVNELKIHFTNGELQIFKSEDEEVKYKCKTFGKTDGARPSVLDRRLTIELSKTTAVECDLMIPKDVSVQVEGTNGDINVKHINSNLSINLMNGKIKFKPDENASYKFKSSILNGKSDEFKSSDEKSAYSINFNIVNGVINHLKG